MRKWDPEELKFFKMTYDHRPFMDHYEDFHLVLQRADKTLENCSDPIIEVGTRAGGSARCFLEIIKRRKQNNWVYTIDPYGAIPWSPQEGVVLEQSGYVNEFYRQAMFEISKMAYQEKLNHYHFRCTSKEFIDWVYPNFTQYDDFKSSKLSNFSFTYIDGDNRWETVKMELDFFLPRSKCVVVDDTQHALEKFDEYCEGRYKLTHMNKRSMVEHL